MSGEEKGVGQCAFDPRHNSTYVFSGESQALHYQSSGIYLSVSLTVHPVLILMDSDKPSDFIYAILVPWWDLENCRHVLISQNVFLSKCHYKFHATWTRPL